VSKRTRGSGRRQRPGTRPPTIRSAADRRPAAQPAREPAATADAIVEPTAYPSAVQSAVERPAPRSAHRQKVKPGSLLATRSANEYVYVGRDIRQILVVSGALFGVLVIGWLLIVVWRIIPLAFY
jgi:hypothetical protein